MSELTSGQQGEIATLGEDTVEFKSADGHFECQAVIPLIQNRDPSGRSAELDGLTGQTYRRHCQDQEQR